jgi:hypothetical protein
VPDSDYSGLGSRFGTGRKRFDASRTMTPLLVDFQGQIVVAQALFGHFGTGSARAVRKPGLLR